MKTVDDYIYKKVVDWSLLTDGITIPFENQVVFSQSISTYLLPGESKEIKIFLNGKTYRAKMYDIGFNKEKYPTHTNILQIRYSRSSDLAQALQAEFIESYRTIIAKRAVAQPRTHVLPDKEDQEFLAIYTTEDADTFLFEAIQNEEVRDFDKFVKETNEVEYENFMNAQDENAGLIKKYHVTKIRKLNHKIGDNLKLLYDFHCQICGAKIGDKYDTHVVECHHIDYFTKSLNNDASNILIVCPNHHRIIHSVNPKFETKEKDYLYPNGVKEGLALNKHL